MTSGCVAGNLSADREVLASLSRVREFVNRFPGPFNLRFFFPPTFRKWFYDIVSLATIDQHTTKTNLVPQLSTRYGGNVIIFSG